MPVTDSSVDFDWFSPEVCRDPQFYGEPRVTTNMAVHGHETLPLRIVPA